MSRPENEQRPKEIEKELQAANDKRRSYLSNVTNLSESGAPLMSIALILDAIAIIVSITLGIKDLSRHDNHQTRGALLLSAGMGMAVLTGLCIYGINRCVSRRKDRYNDNIKALKDERTRLLPDSDKDTESVKDTTYGTSITPSN